MIPNTINSLMKFLKQKGYEAQYQEETDQIYVIFKVGKHEFPLFVRVYDGGNILQLLVFFPLQVPRDRLNAIARLLHFLNKEIDMPGLGMDESVGLVFHRIMLPTATQKIDQDLLESLVNTVPKICDQFFDTLLEAVNSTDDFETIQKKLKS